MSAPNRTPRGTSLKRKSSPRGNHDHYYSAYQSLPATTKITLSLEMTH